MYADFVALIILILALIKKNLKIARISSIVLFLILLTPIGRFALHKLEYSYPNYEIKNEDDIQGLILLGGFFHLGEKCDENMRPIYNLAGGRLSEFVTIAKKYKNLPIIFTGTKEETVLTMKLFDELKIKKSRIIADFDAKNTNDNAKNVFNLLKNNSMSGDKPFLIITSAFHMPRSIFLFRMNGINVEPYSVDYHTRTGSIMKMWYLSFDHMNALCYRNAVKEIFAILDILIINLKKKILKTYNFVT